MKIVYYRALLHTLNELSPNEKILYSFLVAKSITNIDEIFDTDGQTINHDALLQYLDDNENAITLKYFSNSFLSRELHFSRQGIISCMATLRSTGLITLDSYSEECIITTKEIIEGGYFELHNMERLTGDCLVFYSYLYDKARFHDWVVDTMKYKLADDFCKTKIAITKLLNRLYRLGLAERLQDGKLLIK